MIFVEDLDEPEELSAVSWDRQDTDSVGKAKTGSAMAEEMTKEMTEEEIREKADTEDTENRENMAGAGEAEGEETAAEAGPEDAGAPQDAPDTEEGPAAGSGESAAGPGDGGAEADAGSAPDGESAGQDGADGNDSAAKEPKKGFFSRGRREDKEKAALQEKVAELEDRVKRQMAEFDNFRKRTEREKSQMFSMGESSVLEKILPVVDNFERGFDTVAPEDEQDAFVEGMRRIYAQLEKQLADLGVSPIEAVGKPFDPNLHNAVMQMESDELESGTVGQELLKGYMYHDTVLRHSMVAVVS